MAGDGSQLKIRNLKFKMRPVQRSEAAGEGRGAKVEERNMNTNVRLCSLNAREGGNRRAEVGGRNSSAADPTKSD